LRHGSKEDVVLRRLRSAAASPAAHLIAYFLILGAVITAVVMMVPWFRQVLVPGGVATTDLSGLDGVGASSPGVPRTIAETAVLGLLALIGALAFAIPVVWIYTVIMRQHGYDVAFVRLLATLPVVVAGVVQVVRGDLALAFALAGIVAAVRFRTTVKDLQDATFAFAVIGIGLATGTGSFTLAGAIGAVFTLLAWVLFRFDVGNARPSLELSHPGIPLAEALVPGETRQTLTVGDDSAAKPVGVDELPRIAESIDRVADVVRADALRKNKRYNTLLLAYTADPASAREKIEKILSDNASRWTHVDDIVREGGETVALEYVFRLKKNADVEKMLDSLCCSNGGTLQAAELKPIKGLRRKLT
jgi:hypothetical protein